MLNVVSLIALIGLLYTSQIYYELIVIFLLFWLYKKVGLYNKANVSLPILVEYIFFGVLIYLYNLLFKGTILRNFSNICGIILFCVLYLLSYIFLSANFDRFNKVIIKLLGNQEYIYIYIKNKLVDNKHIVVSGYLIGLIAHGMMLFNKISFRDDVMSNNTIGATYTSGRWALGFIEKLVNKILCYTHNIPIVDGLLTISFLIIIVIIINNYLKIENKIQIVLFTGIAVSFPSIVSLFGYIYTAPYYYFGALIGVLGIYLLFRYKNIHAFIISVFLTCFSTAVYQSNISIWLSCIVLFFIKDMHDNRYNLKDFITRSIALVGLCLGSIFLYFVSNISELKAENLQMNNYKGLGNFGITSVSGYLKRVLLAYKEVFYPTNNCDTNMYPFFSRYFYLLLVVIFVILVFVYVYENKNLLQNILLFISFPLAIGFSFVMIPEGTTSALNIYSEVFIFLLIIYLINNVNISIEYLNGTKIICGLLLSLLLYSNVRFSNHCYQKAIYIQTQAISYFTNLIDDIKSTDGYKENMSVCYIGDSPQDDSFIGNYMIKNIYLIPYDKDSLLNDYSWKYFMATWCGFKPLEVSEESLNNKEETNEMAAYPSFGSIKVIDDCVVVKFE